MSETSKPQAMQTLQVTAYNPAEVDIKDFKFKTARQLDKKMRRAERILVFDDPDDPDDPMVLHLRALTEKEEASLLQTQLSETDIEALVSVFLEKTEKGEQIETEDLVNIITDKVMNTHQERDDLGKLCRRIRKAIVKPRGITIQWLERKNPNLLDICNDTIDELQIENERWILEDASVRIAEGAADAENAEGDSGNL